MKKTILTLPVIAFLVANSKAALVIEVFGTNGNNLVSYLASGDIIVTNPTPALSSSTGAAPLSGLWNTPFDNNLGDFIKTGNSNDLNLVLSDNISYLRNSIEFAQIEAFDIGATETAGGDDFEIDMLGTVSYPALIIGDIISWTGSGTFSLSGLNTYDSYFEPGTYNSAIDGGEYQLIINPTIVPEPSSTALIGFGGLLLILRRRNTKLNNNW